ncbi:unnamed protein product [Linum trigynum]|uniref:Uncharacterized protein n=1 Tax=Linum trigynum TaxID=586398 RepID=A0AAV2FZ98_9ROSI
MEFGSLRKREQSFPPKRGQIKMRIIKSLISSAAAAIGTSSGGKLKISRRDGDGGDGFSSSSSICSLAPATPPATPTGYLSNAEALFIDDSRSDHWLPSVDHLGNSLVQLVR